MATRYSWRPPVTPSTPASTKNLRYDPIENFAAIGFVSTLPYLLVVHTSVPGY